MLFSLRKVAPVTIITNYYRVRNLTLKNYWSAHSGESDDRPTRQNLYFLTRASLQDDGSMHKANSLKLYIRRWVGGMKPKAGKSAAMALPATPACQITPSVWLCHLPCLHSMAGMTLVMLY